MFDTFRLCATEQPLYERLSPQLREGWSTTEEQEIPADDPAKRTVRFHMLKFHDPKMKELQDALRQSPDTKAIVALIKKTNLKDVSQDDLMELMYAAGPVVLSHLIAYLLQDVQTDEQMEDVAALTFLRHELLLSVQ